jgi:hypothetical protein
LRGLADPLCAVIGKLDTPDHAEYVSHTHADSQVRPRSAVVVDDGFARSLTRIRSVRRIVVFS